MNVRKFKEDKLSHIVQRPFSSTSIMIMISQNSIALAILGALSNMKIFHRTIFSVGRRDTALLF